MSQTDKYKNIGYQDFKLLALDPTLSQHEKIGFPNSYREGQEPIIIEDLLSKLKNLGKTKQIVLDIGSGCGELTHALIKYCADHEHSLVLIDSKEVLDQLPNGKNILKLCGYFPTELESELAKYMGRVNCIISYSVLHYVFAEGNLFYFLDHSLALLAEQGELLIGDIPNSSKRKRFFSSQSGVKYHRNFTKSETLPEVSFNTLEPKQIDDSVLLSLMMRARQGGFDAYILPQDFRLSMSNRREDLLFIRP